MVEVAEQTNRVALVLAGKPLRREEVEAAVRETPHEGTGRARQLDRGEGAPSDPPRHCLL